MKNLKNVFAAMALVLAFGAALASTLDVTALSKKEVVNGSPTGSCIGISLSVACNTTSSNNCQFVDDGDGKTYRFYSDASCSTAYKKP